MAGKTNITVAVATHKPYQMPSDPCYLPLHVGATMHPEVCVSMQQDNVGENISDRNDIYSELTGMYWMWKNCKSSFKGLVHYRRHFRTLDSDRSRSKNRFDRIATEADFLTSFENQKCEILVPKARNYYIDSIGGHYRATLPEEQLDSCRAVLCDIEPSYVRAFDSVLASREAHLFNMFVARDYVFDAYCAWLFPVLEELCRVHDPSLYDPFNARYPGRISEILLDAWMDVNSTVWKELPVVSPEPIDWVAKGKGFLAAKFLGRKYERSF